MIAVDETVEAYQEAGGRMLYWGDSGTNRIQRCVLDFAMGGAGNCTHGVSNVLTGVGHIAGLALDSRSNTLYWADGLRLRVFSASVDRASGVVASRRLQPDACARRL